MINGDNMFILDKSKFGDFDLTNAEQFVDIWSHYYEYTLTDENEYLNELNITNDINNDLTEDNIKKLLQWKSPRWLAEKKRNGEDNPKVKKVIEEIESINDFRHDLTSEDEFLEIIRKKIFSDGLIYPIFLFHIARPYQYPIADKNVFIAYSILNPKKDFPKNCKSYKAYKEFFIDLAKKAGIISNEPKGIEKNIYDIVKGLKKVDNALFEFGIFWNKYNK